MDYMTAVFAVYGSADLGTEKGSNKFGSYFVGPSGPDFGVEVLGLQVLLPPPSHKSRK